MFATQLRYFLAYFWFIFGLFRYICNKNLSILIPDVTRKKARRTETEIEKITKCVARSGTVKFDEQFHDVSEKIIRELKKKIKKLETEYTTPYNGSIP